MKETTEDILYQIALLELTNVGPIVARKIINYFGSAKEVIFASEKELIELGSVGKKILKQDKDDCLRFAEAQLKFCEGQGAEVLSFFSQSYPYRLKECSDAPQVIYKKGHCNLNQEKIVAIVGTRDCTAYGKDFCNALVDELQKVNACIVSGLAYGIDACSHERAIHNDLYNIAVVAHGLDRIYPGTHRDLANRIIGKGAILTEFPTKTNPDRENFPQRNRIVAGMVDAVVVIESRKKGGSMITARLGNDYSRDVFAVPGRVNDVSSEGCNHLISNELAHLLNSPEDLLKAMGWNSSTSSKAVQQKMVFDLNEQESKLYSVVSDSPQSFDEIAQLLGWSSMELSTQLLMLELRDCIKQLPGKKYIRA